MTIARETAGIRDALVRALEWQDAHVSFEAAVADLPAFMRGRVPSGMPYSVWQLAEHIRLAQLDILDFCRNPEYREQTWPDDYWPPAAEPPDEDSWKDCLAGVLSDRAALAHIVGDSGRGLLDPIPHGNGQTLLREALLVLDHNAYHVGQIVLVRRALGAWPG